MSDPFDLPVELLDRILTLAFDIIPRGEWENGALDTLEVNSLSRLLLVSRKWHQVLIPRLYSCWTYNGARHTYVGLWRLLRTVLQNPDLAAEVRVLNIGNWELDPPVYLNSDLGVDRKLELQDKQFKLSLDDKGLVSKAIHQAGFTGELESKFLDGIFLEGNHDRSPLVALLLTCLPRVETVYAHLPAKDLFFRAILQTAFDRQQSGQHLTYLASFKELYILSEVPGFPEDDHEPQSKEIEEPPLKLDNLWPVFYLEGLRSLHLYNVDTEGAGSLLHQERGYTCHIEHLHIATKQTSTCTPADLAALLTLPRGLKSLSFCWSGDKTKSKEKVGKKKQALYLENLEQRSMECHSEISEHARISVFHDMPAGSHHNKATNHFGLLKPFALIKYLSISAEVLVGGYSDESIALFRLKDTLPPNLEFLVLCVGIAGKTIPDFTSQLNEVVSGPEYLCLKSLQVSDSSVVNIYRPSEVTPENYQMVEETCARNGIRFDIRGVCNPADILTDCPFPAGGRRYVSAKQRAVRRAADLRETPSPTPTRMILATHVVPFTDHRGGRSFTVFENDENCPLPPLVQFSIYFTHAHSHPDSHPGGYPDKADLVGLHDKIRDTMEDFHFRLDIYFLPGGQETDCISHYKAERAVRDNSIAMIQETKERLENNLPPATPPRLPGMLSIYSDGGERYGGLLYIYPDRSWRDGEQQMCCVRFEPKFTGASQSVFTEWQGFPDPNLEEVDEDNIFGPSDEYSLGSWMWEYTVSFQEEAQEVFYPATRRGWTSW
ncbi:hypothetical protein BDW59DRAFT_158425 [Aspergillus cavernicola]|uniref:F-box domain-containing protein n=1 Tax=Aspergillus cavernicola TaxID=176166 RepID=A0ABR4IRV8_9EURO